MLADPDRLQQMTAAAALAGHRDAARQVAEVALEVARAKYRADREVSAVKGLPPELQRVRMVGIGGAGMSGIARILLDRGGQVSGSDAKESRGVAALRARGAQIRIGHDGSALDMLDGGPTAVVTTRAAIPKTNPELVEARRRGIPVILRPVVLAKLMAGDTTLMVTGTAGKTTTTSMLIVALQHSGFDPSFAVGEDLGAAGTNAHHGGGAYFVAEADESDGSLVQYQPDIAVVTNIEADHLDFFGTEQAYVDVFDAFIERLTPGGALVVVRDDPGAAALAARTAALGIRVLRYGSTGGDLAGALLDWEQHGTSAVATVWRLAGERRPTDHAVVGARPAHGAQCAGRAAGGGSGRRRPRRGARRAGRVRGCAAPVRTGRGGGRGEGVRRLRPSPDEGVGRAVGGTRAGRRIAGAAPSSSSSRICIRAHKRSRASSAPPLSSGRRGVRAGCLRGARAADRWDRRAPVSPSM